MSAFGLILNAILLTPYLIRKLGTDQYGIWALGLSLVEYFWMIDLGVRPATVKMTAEFKALESWDQLNNLLSTAAGYSAVMGLAIFGLISFNTGAIAHFYRITNPEFPLLVHAVSLSWAFGLVFNVFEAALEGFQRFDITGRTFICFVLARSLTLVLVVTLGYGLAGMAAALLGTQLLMYLSFFISLRRIHPLLHISPWNITRKAGREIWLYARQVISAMLSARLVSAAIPSLITRILGVRSLAYYSFTQKTLDYAGEGIGRIGLITAPRAADWMTRGYRPQLMRLAEYGNRYCLTLWLVVATFLMIFGKALFGVWINPEFAEKAGVLLPVMLVGYTFWLGQFVSASILMGVGWYGEYSGSLMVEAVLTVAGFALVLPHYGLIGGVAVSTLLIFTNRCVNLSRIFAKKFEIKLVPFLWRIYRVPLCLAVVDGAALWVVRRTWLPGTSLRQLIEVGFVNSIVFAAVAFWLVLEPDHREIVVAQMDQKLRRFTGHGIRNKPA